MHTDPLVSRTNSHSAMIESILVGDRESDIIAAERFGVRGILCDSESGLASVIDEIASSKER